MIAFFRMSETIVFIDAGFLSKLSSYFGKGKYLKYDIINFSESLAEKETLSCQKIFYYTAPPFQCEPPTKEETRMINGYSRFINKLLKREKITIQEGRCQKIINAQGQIDYHQKGVDVLLTMDLMRLPIDYPKIKNVILIASDSDFVPIIQYLKKLNINIILYTHYSRKRHSNISTSNKLLKTVSKYVELTKQDFINAPLLKKKEKIK